MPLNNRIAAGIAIAVVSAAGAYYAMYGEWIAEDDAPKVTNAYDPARSEEWQRSGPFSIDRSEYAIGENVFLLAEAIPHAEKGQIVFMRPVNDTHRAAYLAIPFDGSAGPFNQYFKPALSQGQNICTVDDLAGKWLVVFRGTDYPDIEFEINPDIMVPGEERNYKPQC